MGDAKVSTKAELISAKSGENAAHMYYPECVSPRMCILPRMVITENVYSREFLEMPKYKDDCAELQLFLAAETRETCELFRRFYYIAHRGISYITRAIDL